MPSSMYPKLAIPSGFEGQQLSIERKRKLADAMLSRNLDTKTDYRSWAQAISQIGQAWMGKSMQKDADKEQTELGGQVREQYSTALGGFAEDEKLVKAGQMSPMELVQKHRSNPLLGEVLGPYEDAMKAGLTASQRKKLVDVMVGGKRTPMMEGDDGSYSAAPTGMAPLNKDQKLENGVMIDPTQMQIGDRGPQNPNSDVILDANGNMTPNLAKVAATRGGQGFGFDYNPGPVPNAPTAGGIGRASEPMNLGSAIPTPAAPAQSVATAPNLTLPTDGPLGPWIEQSAGRSASPRGRQRATGVKDTYHADNHARDFPTATKADNLAEGRRLKGIFGPQFDVIYGKDGHWDHVHVEPGPALGKQVRSQKREAVIGDKKYVIIGGKAYEDDGN